MQLSSSEPDIATLVRRVDDRELDLQPDFQRGEVWAESKRQRLIDSVLRHWHVPPIHVIQDDATGLQEVLDGQQRLRAIRDFVHGDLIIDGSIEPTDPAIRALHGLNYTTLPLDVRRRFDTYPIRVITISRFSPDEPAELFFRLNQPTSLTSAEQRNAFFGPPRQQVRQLVALLANNRINRDFVGFSNARMAYDDVLARLAYLRERGTLHEKVTSAALAERYRSGLPFKKEVEESCRRAITTFGIVREAQKSRFHLNKATMFSWLWFFADISSDPMAQRTSSILSDFFAFFEEFRTGVTGEARTPITFPDLPNASVEPFLASLLHIYNDRASSRVADISSVLARDSVIWVFFTLFALARKIPTPHIALKVNAVVSAISDLAQGGFEAADLVDRLSSVPGWGGAL